MTEAIAQDIIQQWLTAKSAAMGEDHDVAALERILTGDLLTRWQGQANQSAEEGWYWEYEHPEIEILNVIVSEEDPDRATVEARVQEVGEFYTDGQLILAESYDSSVEVSYDIIRQDGQWKIEAVGAL
jgi:hypothetical protein